MFEITSNDKDAWSVRQEHEVFFIPSFWNELETDHAQAIQQGTLAGKLPANAFEGSHCVVKTWAVKWGPLGLTPVRPLVLFKLSCDIPAGQALSL